MYQQLATCSVRPEGIVDYICHLVMYNVLHSIRQLGGGACLIHLMLILLPFFFPPANPCLTNPCLNGGVCVVESLTEYSCVCPECYSGETCDLGKYQVLVWSL